ncbi:unnamed protein product, partial [marine sediment metagenome]
MRRTKLIRVGNDFLEFLDKEIKPEMLDLGVDPTYPQMGRFLKNKYIKINGFVKSQRIG